MLNYSFSVKVLWKGSSNSSGTAVSIAWLMYLGETIHPRLWMRFVLESGSAEVFLVVNLFYHMLPSYRKFAFLQLLFSHVLNLPLTFVQDCKRRSWHCAVSQGLTDFAQAQNE